MTGQRLDPGPPAGAGHDLVEPRSAQRPAPAGGLEHNEDPIGVGLRGPFVAQVGRQRVEEPRRDRHDPLVTALAVGDEHPPLPSVDVLEPQPKHLTTTQPSQQHRVDHRPVPMLAKRAGERIDLSRIDHPRKHLRGPDQRHATHRPLATSTRCQPLRHRTRCHITTHNQIVIEPRDRSQPTLDRPCRQTRLTVLDPHHVARHAGLTLHRNKPQHISRDNLDRIHLNDREEHLQVIGLSQQRVRRDAGGPGGREVLLVYAERPGGSESGICLRPASGAG